MIANMTNTAKTYSHAYTIAFELSGSTCEEGSDVTPEQLIAALRARINDIEKKNEVEEAIGAPFDTHEEE